MQFKSMNLTKLFADARYGIGMPKREPPPRRHHQSSRPKRQYRKKTRPAALLLTATTTNSVNEEAHLKVSKLPRNSERMSTCERSANPPTLSAEFSRTQTNHAHGVPVSVNGSERDNGIIGQRNLLELLVGSCSQQTGLGMFTFSSTSYRDTSSPSMSSCTSTMSNSRTLNSGYLGASLIDKSFLLRNSIPPIGPPM